MSSLPKTGGYQKLCEYVGRGNNEEWTDDDRMNFSSFHLAFYNAYKALGGLELKDITEDDALLLYLSLYPYNESMEKLTGEIKKDLEKIWPEIKTLTVEEPVELLITPTTETSMIKKIQSKKVHKVAFVYDVPPSKSDWIYAQELGAASIFWMYSTGRLRRRSLSPSLMRKMRSYLRSFAKRDMILFLQSHQCLFVPASKWHRCIQIQKY